MPAHARNVNVLGVASNNATEETTIDDALVEHILEAWLARPDEFHGSRAQIRPYTRKWLAANYDAWTAKEQG